MAITTNNEHNENLHSPVLSEDQLAFVSGGMQQSQFQSHLYSYNLPEEALEVYRSDAYWNSHRDIRHASLIYLRSTFEALKDQYAEDPEGFYNDLAKLKAELNM